MCSTRDAVVDGMSCVVPCSLREHVSWAVDVPDDPAHSVYVWLDALVNYITVAGYGHQAGATTDAVAATEQFASDPGKPARTHHMNPVLVVT